MDNHVGGEWFSNLNIIKLQVIGKLPIFLTHLDLSYVQNLNSSYVWLQVIGKLPKVHDLELSHCHLSDLYLHSLSHSLLNFSTSLGYLDLSWNTFSSSETFEWVFNTTSNLIRLDLSNNIFKGTISYDFCNIRNQLEILDLSGNELQGGFLESVRDICTLHSLSLDINKLNEDISTFLSKLSGCARYSQRYLSLSQNKITGTLPNLSTFPSLIDINLYYNRLSGKIPDGNKFLPSKFESEIWLQLFRRWNSKLIW